MEVDFAQTALRLYAVTARAGTLLIVGGWWHKSKGTLSHETVRVAPTVPISDFMIGLP